MAPSPTADATRFGRFRPGVPRHEHTGNTAFEVIRRPLLNPTSRPVPDEGQIGPGHHETALVALHDSFEPLRTGQRADEHEEELGIGTVSVAPDVLSRNVSVSKCSFPLPAITSVHVRTEMLGIVSICWIR